MAISSPAVLQTKIEKLETNMARLDSIVNGDASTDVAIDVGTVPTIAKFYASVSAAMYIDVNDNTFYGNAGNGSLSGADNSGLGKDALDALTTGSRNIGIGKGALALITTATDNVGIGVGSLALTTNIRNTAVGNYAGGGITSGDVNTFLGYGAGSNGSGQNATVTRSVAIGAFAYTTLSNQLAFPNDVDSIRAFGEVMFIGLLSKRAWFYGELAGNRVISGGAIVGIGSVALANVTTGTQLVAVGDYAMNNQTTASNCAAVGAQAMRYGNLIDTVALGSLTFCNATTGVGGVAIGHRSQEFTLNVNNNVGVGDSTLWLNQGVGNVSIGYRTNEYTVSGDDNVVIGRGASVNRASGSRNVYIGQEAGSFPGVTPNPTTGVGAQAAGNDNTVMGYRALRNGTSNDNVVIGTSAGESITTGDKNTFIGKNSGNNGSQLVSATNSMALGYGSYTDASNQVVIGDANVTEVKIRSASAKLNLLGGQIQFPASQNASSNANTLDDYEEGTSTPTVTAASGTFTSVSCALDYTKVGDRVFWSATITITTNGTAAGELIIPLPFTSAVASCCNAFSSVQFKSGGGRVVAGTASARISQYDATTFCLTGNIINVSGQFKI